MKKCAKKIIFISTTALFLLSSVSFLNKSNLNAVKVDAATTYTNHDEDTYYSSIKAEDSGDTLLRSLQSLNSTRRKTTVGYSSMSTSASGSFKYTDYDPETVKYDSKNQPYGTKVLSFYSGNKTTSFNREHVWPKSHGGNLVENDIHMTRPTIEAENGARGNSFYVEGKCDQANGWDPAMESFGKESYRGDAARIIFYCVVAAPQLRLQDIDYHYSTNQNRDNLMGKLSDLLRWNLNYSVQDREKNRNEGAEYLQGNRNPFIDHPEYACRIWGNTNAATKAICSASAKVLSSISIDVKPTKMVYVEGENFDPSGVVITAHYSDGSTENVTNKVTWSSSKLVSGQTSITATFSENGIIKEVVLDDLIVAKEIIPVTGLNLEFSSVELMNDTSFEIPLIIFPSNATNKNVEITSSNHSVVSISDNVLNAENEGESEITVTTKDGNFSKKFNVVVKPNLNVEASSKLVEMKVVNHPTKSFYSIGDTFNKEGIQIEGHYLDGSSRDITEECGMTTPILDSKGRKKVYFTHEGIEQTFFEVVVNDSPVDLIMIDNEPNRLDYYVGEEIDLNGLKVSAICLNGESIDVSDICTCSTRYVVSGMPMLNIKLSESYAYFRINIKSGLPSVDEKGLIYSNVFTEKLSNIQAKNITLNDWQILQYKFNTLDFETKEMFKYVDKSGANVVLADTSPLEISNCVAKYDFIYLERRSDGFEDFMDRNPKLDTEKPKTTGLSIVLIAIVGVAAISILVFTIITVTKRKKSGKSNSKKKAI